MIRGAFASIAFLLLAGCRPANPALLPALPPSVPLPAPTSTPFLPRGFSFVPSPAIAASPRILATDSGKAGLDLDLALGRLNQLRQEAAATGLDPDAKLGEAAQERAVALADSQALWHARPGQSEAEVGQKLRSTGFSGRVAEIVLSLDLAGPDHLGSLLTALLTDVANRSVALDPSFHVAGIGYAEREGRAYVVVLLAESTPSE